MLPEPLKKIIEIFSSFPSLGPRQAARLAFYLANLGKGKITEIADAVSDLGKLKTCSDCFFVYAERENRGASKNLCEICRSEKRNKNLVMIVEKETDLISIERTQKWDGRYLVLGESPKAAVLESIQKLRLNTLKTGPKKEEIIIAINPTVAGDLTAALIASEIKPFAQKISRLGRGLPVGGEVEFADEETLSEALKNRG